MSHKEEWQFSLHFPEGQKAGIWKKVQKIPVVGLLPSHIISVIGIVLESSLLDMIKYFFTSPSLLYLPLWEMQKHISSFPQAAPEDLNKWELS